MADKPIRRMTLRQLLTHAEKSVRDLIELINSAFLSRVSDFRDLSRPVRRRSHYPSVLALHNALRKFKETGEQAQQLAQDLNEHLDAIREHANRERVNRL